MKYLIYILYISNEKTMSKTYNKEEYMYYIHSENGDKRYLI